MKAPLNWKPGIDYWRALGLLLLLKVGYLYVHGPVFLPESETWLTSGVSVLNPPIYGWWIKGLMQIYPSPYTIIIAQILLFSAALAGLLQVLLNSRKLFYIATVLLAFDPNSADACNSLYPGAVYLSLLFIGLAIFHLYLRTPTPWALLGMVVISTLVFLTRFQGLILLILYVFYLPFFAAHRRYWWRTSLILIAGFQLMLIPVRIYYSAQLDTWWLNGYTGMSVWNGATVNYCKSSPRVDPRTKFEVFAAYKSCQSYSIQHAVTGWHLKAPHSTLNLYLENKSYKAPEMVSFSEELFRTSLRIILQHPGGYILQYVIPNITRILIEDEEIHLPLSETLIKQFKYFPLRDIHNYNFYNRSYVWIGISLMIFNLLFQVWLHNSIGFISLLNIGYFLSTSIMGPLHTHEFLLLSPLILINVVFLWDKLYYRNKYFRFAYRGL
jgi:hypothetical protein